MPELNLLPWREQLRDKQKQQLVLLLLLSIACALLILWLWHMLIQSHLQQQTARNHFLQKHIAKLEQQLKEINYLVDKKQKLLTRVNNLIQLYNSKAATVYLFNWAAGLPTNILIEQLQRHNHYLSLTAKAKSSANISQLIANINQTTWLTEPTLTEMSCSTQFQNYNCHFKLQFKQKTKLGSERIK